MYIFACVFMSFILAVDFCSEVADKEPSVADMVIRMMEIFCFLICVGAFPQWL